MVLSLIDPIALLRHPFKIRTFLSPPIRSVLRWTRLTCKQSSLAKKTSLRRITSPSIRSPSKVQSKAKITLPPPPPRKRIRVHGTRSTLKRKQIPRLRTPRLVAKPEPQPQPQPPQVLEVLRDRTPVAPLINHLITLSVKDLYFATQKAYHDVAFANSRTDADIVFMERIRRAAATHGIIRGVAHVRNQIKAINPEENRRKALEHEVEAKKLRAERKAREEAEAKEKEETDEKNRILDRKVHWAPRIIISRREQRANGNNNIGASQPDVDASWSEVPGLQHAALLARQNTERELSVDIMQKCWALYEHRWEVFVGSRQENIPTLLTAGDLPWPTMNDGLTYKDIEIFILNPLRPGHEVLDWRERIEKEIGRWALFDSLVLPFVKGESRAEVEYYARFVKECLEVMKGKWESNDSHRMMDRIDSGATDDSAFDSVLNTPADEDVLPPFERIGERLLNDNEKIFSSEAKHLNATSKNSGFGEKTFSSISTLDLNCAISPRATVGHGDHECDVGMNMVPSSSEQSTCSSADEGPDMLSAELGLPSFATPRIEPSNSAISSSPELESESFCRHQRASSLYTLPNEPICVSQSTVSPSISSLELTTPKLETDIKSSKSVFLNVPALTLSHSQAESLQDKEEVAQTLTETEPQTNAQSSNENAPGLNTQDIPTNLLKLAFFLPWCIAAGCTLLIFPKHIEFVVFAPGYYTTSSSSRGIHRFAELAENTIPHVGIFLGLLALVVYWNFALGMALTALIVSQGVLAWQDFDSEGAKNVPLGEDDRVAVYWVLKSYVGGCGVLAGMCKTQEGAFVMGNANGGNIALEDDEDEGVDDY
ncbi:hypothetical protein VNI00_007125 [Paramarasmius palmivorus]|uniref:Uncharacterized protein n=1 Tax=Paramarasmius palmivorus TaxID=297713 RepID=A0AAW0D2W3_9AGAR